MKARVIVIEGDKRSEEGARALNRSRVEHGNSFELETFEATTPATVERHMRTLGVEWTYPWEVEEKLIVKGLTLRPYKTSNRAARISCFCSHYRLWLKCLALQEPILILEDDALFVRKFDPEDALESGFAVVGINSPIGATRLANVYHDKVQAQEESVCEVPWVDSTEVPQGLAGASAYVLRPEGAAKAIELVRLHGAWPNDCSLNKQLMPGQLGQTRTYFTKVQGRPSTLA